MVLSCLLCDGRTSEQQLMEIKAIRRNAIARWNLQPPILGCNWGILLWMLLLQRRVSYCYARRGFTHCYLTRVSPSERVWNCKRCALRQNCARQAYGVCEVELECRCVLISLGVIFAHFYSSKKRRVIRERTAIEWRDRQWGWRHGLNAVFCLKKSLGVSMA